MAAVAAPQVRISQDDVGHRVVVRRRLPGETGPTGGQAYTDILGILEHCDAVTLWVRRSDRAIVEIPVAEIAHAKRVPPPPASRRR